MGYSNTASLKDRVAIITGAAGGIGFEACKALQDHGAIIVISDINADRGEVVVKELGVEFLRADPCVKKVPYTGITFVGIPEFQSFGSLVGQNVAGVVAGKMSVEKALKDSQALVERAMKQAGYIK